MDAEALFRAGRLAEARAAYEGVLAERPADAPALRRLGTLALYENRPEEAVRRLRGALEHGPRRWPLSLPVRAQLGMALYRLSRFGEAARELRAAAGPVPAGPLADLAGLARHFESAADRRPYRIDGPALTRLPLLATDPLPAVELAVNGERVLCFVDTGGCELVLDERLAARVGATRVSSMRGEYGGRRRARTGLGWVDAVEAGDLRIGDVPVHMLDLGGFPDHFGLDVRGIVGTRLLMRFTPTIDYRGGALVLRRGPVEAADGGIPFWLAEAHLILARGRLNGLPPTLFWVDTGLAGGGFLAREATLRAAGVRVDWSTARFGPGGGGPVKQTDVVIDSVTLGDGADAVTHTGVPGMAFEKAPSILGRRLGFEVGGLISHAFFRPHALTLDFARMRLVLGP